MRFHDFFDEYNPEHMRAYEQLCKTGSWPAGFIPDNCDMQNNLVHCLLEMHSKMAQAWLRAMKHGLIIGSAPFEDEKNEGDQQ